ncbi:MAG: ATP-binding cassette domain-containing protein [Chitinophagaceae bacterium]
MNIRLQNIIPIPLKAKITATKKDVWNNEVCFSKGEQIKIVAPSGTGKTTLMHYLYGTRQDYEGNIFYDDVNLRSINSNDLAAIRQLKLSIIFQDLRLFPQLTAKENIELKRTMTAPFYPSEKIDEMAETIGITHILNQQTSKCSYGEQQRIAIIRALIQPFELLLMDEPFSHLDNNNTAKAAALINDECKKRNAGFVITDLDEDKNFNYTKVLYL